MQGAGGIGGLLAKVESGATHAYLLDGNGNVGQLVNASTGSVDAQYEYDAYGNSIVASGTQATANPFRFSTKYLDTESGLYYYGYRYYDPETGRWTNRDPIEENGGTNLYSFVLNSSLNNIDPHGLDTIAFPRNPWVTIVPIVLCKLFPDQCTAAGEAVGDLANQGLDNLRGNTGLVGTTAYLVAQQMLNRETLKDKIRKFWDEFKKNCKRIYPVSKTLTPDIHQHTLKAFALGKPPVLTYAGDGAKAADVRRRLARRGAGIIGPAGIVNNIVMEWDEYPYASTLEGGFGASVMPVPAWENKGVQGPTLRFFYSLTKIKPGEKFTVLPIP